jgi:HlyD family secretion protein
MTTVKHSSLVEERRQNEFATVPVTPQPELDQKPPSGGKRKWLLWVLLGSVLLAGSTMAWSWFTKPAAAAYTVVNVRRGNLSKTINATGKVQAVTTVQLGTQVSGTVSELHADFNDPVHAGQIIARLDPSQIQAQLQQAKASLASAEARVATARSSRESQTAAVAAAQANVDRANSVLLEAERAYKNTAALLEAGAVPARQLETFEAARNQAAAQKAQAEAQYHQAVAQAQASRSQLDQALAEATQSKASVEVAAVNLERTYIRAPIDGVVVSRNVDVGQTVAASLQSPTLFLIAKDLTQMQVLADIDEADVGQLTPDSKVSFTVDAFPTETFVGRISQIRLSPMVVQNVVTYTAVIDVTNPKLQLKPGMTATVTATVAEKRDVLVVPNAAVRFRPAGEQAPRTGGNTVWKVDGKELKPVRVQLGMNDGVSTEVIAEGLKEGDRIAAPAQSATAQRGTQAGSPFSGGGNQGRRGRI